MIYDCFLFFNELDILELRFKEMGHFANWFVIVEATRTFSGKPKPLYFADNRSRFSQWDGQIIHVVVDDMPNGDVNAWDREYFQYECIKRGPKKVDGDDILIISDVDEIPSSRQINEWWAPGMGDVVSMHQRGYYYYFNLRWRHDFFHSKIVSGRAFNKMGIGQIRKGPVIPNLIMPDAGWHFTNMGGIDSVVAKTLAGSHWNEPSTNEFLNNLKTIGPVATEQKKLKVVKLDESFPADVWNNALDWYRRGFLYDPK